MLCYWKDTAGKSLKIDEKSEAEHGRSWNQRYNRGQYAGNWVEDNEVVDIQKFIHGAHAKPRNQVRKDSEKNNLCDKTIIFEQVHSDGLRLVGVIDVHETLHHAHRVHNNELLWMDDSNGWQFFFLDFELFFCVLVFHFG